MPYHFRWLDEERRILVVRLHDPLASFEAEQLLAELRSVIETPRPIFVLADIRDFSGKEGMSELVRHGQHEPLPLNGSYLDQSRVAVLGADKLISIILGVTHSLMGRDLIHAFEYEDEAIAWLQEQADQVI